MKKITFSIGLLDKDTHKQVFTSIEAKKIVTKLCVEKFWWGTIYETEGIYKHDDWSIVVEPSLVVMTLTNKDIKDFIDETKRILNQESILVQKEVVEYDFA
jgi:N-acetylmuramoyl-L-alanine amidase CwlA